MKGIYSLAILFLATLATFTLGQSLQDIVIPTKCPRIDPKNTTIHLAHKDCTKFYMCLRGQKIEMKCPYMDHNGNRLHFNPRLQVCDWPYRAGCKGKGGVTPSVTHPTTPSSITTSYITPSSSYITDDDIITISIFPSITTKVSDIPTQTITPQPPRIQTTPMSPSYCPQNTNGKTIKIRHEICNYYYLCNDGDMTVQKCPDGKFFNPELGVCDFPENVNCDDSIVISSTKPPTNKCSSKDGKMVKLPHECQCDKYYECHDDDMILKVCPSGLHYDWKRKFCDIPLVVKCVQPIPPPFFSTASTYDKCSSKDEGTKYAHQSSCTVYYECVNRQMVLKQCMPGLHFNVILQICEYPDKECTISTPSLSDSPPIVTIYPDTTESTSRNICPKDSAEKVLLPHECSCTDYYECINGLQIVRKCPSGQHYDYIRQTCDDSKIVECTRLIPPSAGSMKPTTPDDEECSDDDIKIVKFPHKTECILYYQCAHGKKILKSCGIGLVFNPSLRICDFPENVKECNSTLYDTRSVPDFPTASKACSLTDSSGKKRLPHECDCKKYYVCYYGYKILQDCPAGFEYNYEHGTCDKPEIAKCCQSIPIPTEKHGIPACPNSPTCAGKKDGTRVPNKYDCTSYYRCDKGHQIKERCHDNLRFNPLLGVCDFAENVDCTNNDPIPHPWFQCPEVGHIKIPHESNCRLYYECNNGMRIKHQCSYDWHFNPMLGVCDLPENYPCNFDIVNTETTPKYIQANKQAGCIGDCPWKDPANYTVLIPHTDCHKFCMCSNGIAYEQSCPSDLLYDYLRKVCDYPHKVHCKVPPKQVFKIDRENEYQGNQNDWLNYVKEDDDDAENAKKFLV